MFISDVWPDRTTQRGVVTGLSIAPEKGFSPMTYHIEIKNPNRQLTADESRWVPQDEVEDEQLALDLASAFARRHGVRYRVTKTVTIAEFDKDGKVER